MDIKQVGSILLILILLVGCQKNEGKEQYSQSKLDGVDIKDILNLVLVDSGATYSAPDSLLVQKAFAPCKLEGKDGEMQGTCPIYADGNYLVNVDENPKHDNKVEITTGGSGKGVNYLQLESENPNSIYYALNEKDYKQSDYECDDSRAGNWEFKKISTVNKKDFTIALNKNVSASSGWGWLRVYLDGTSPDKACELKGKQKPMLLGLNCNLTILKYKRAQNQLRLQLKFRRIIHNCLSVLAIAIIYQWLEHLLKHLLDIFKLVRILPTQKLYKAPLNILMDQVSVVGVHSMVLR
jgi:hypothetical protein